MTFGWRPTAGGPGGTEQGIVGSHRASVRIREFDFPNGGPRADYVVQVAPLRVKAVGVALLLVQVPWKPSVTEPPAAMEPL